MTLGRPFRLGSDRRAARRAVVDRVFLHGLPHGAGAAAGERIAAVCLDLSAAGCRIHVPRRPPAPDQLLGLVFAPHGSDPMLARVVRVERATGGGYDVGLAFERLSARDRSRLEGWRAWWSRSGRRTAAPAESRLEAVDREIQRARLQVLPPVVQRTRLRDRRR